MRLNSWVLGLATFDNLNIDKIGTGYTLIVTSGTLTAAISNAFDVTSGSASKLVFTQQPTNGVIGDTISPMIVEIRDVNENLVNDSSDTITIALGSNPCYATLSGTASINASGGVATFSNLMLKRCGKGYTLSATSGILTSATSASFNVIGPERLSVDSNGAQGNGRSYQPSFSADGRYVAFDSIASNLVAGDTNGYDDVFITLNPFFP